MYTPLLLGNWTITESIDRYIDEAQRQATFNFRGMMGVAVEQLATQVYPLISLLLYVCSNAVEFDDQHTPNNPSPKRTKKGWRLFPAEKPRVWRLGGQLCESLRQAKVANSMSKTGPSPHMRRAHWHGYWVASKPDQKFKPNGLHQQWLVSNKKIKKHPTPHEITINKRILPGQ